MIDATNIDIPIPFTFAGKCEGRASLSLTLQENGRKIGTRFTKFRVYPSVLEMTRYSAFILSIVVGLGTLLLWRRGLELKDAVMVGAATGAILVALLLLLGQLLVRWRIRSG